MAAEILSDLTEQIWINHELLSTNVFSTVLCPCDTFLVTLLILLRFHRFQNQEQVFQCSVIFRQDGGKRQLQQRRDLPVLQARDRVEQHDAPLFVSEACQCTLQQRALVGVQSALPRWNGVPFLLTEGGMAFFPPQARQAEVSAYSQQPAHGRAGGPVLLRAVLHLHIDVLRQVLRVLCVFEVGQR